MKELSTDEAKSGWKLPELSTDEAKSSWKWLELKPNKSHGSNYTKIDMEAWLGK